MFRVVPVRYREVRNIFEALKTENQANVLGNIASEDPVFSMAKIYCAGASKISMAATKRAAAEITEDLNAILEQHKSPPLRERGICLVIIETATPEGPTTL